MVNHTRPEKLGARDQAAAGDLAVIMLTGALVSTCMAAIRGSWWYWLGALSGLISGAQMICIARGSPGSASAKAKNTEKPDSECDSDSKVIRKGED